MKQANLILIIDDNSIARRVLHRQLTLQGYEVEAAATGPIGLTTLMKGKVDLVLLDFVMQPLTGIEVLRRIRRSYPFSHLPVLMMTSTRDGDLVLQADELGASDFLFRPFQLADLLSRIDHHLSVSRTVGRGGRGREGLLEV